MIGSHNFHKAQSKLNQLNLLGEHMRTMYFVAILVGLIVGNASSSVNDDFHFGAGSFSKEMWIDNKTIFEKPTGVDVEFVNAVPSIGSSQIRQVKKFGRSVRRTSMGVGRA
jgi:hypothetical protein